MRVLIVSESKPDRDAMTKYLTERAHAVDSAATTRSALAMLDADLREVVVLDWSNTSREFLQSLRAMQGDKHVYSIVAMAQPVASSVSAAFAAGADDLLRRPFLREELVARVGAIERIRRWASKILVHVDGLPDLSRLRVTHPDQAIGQDLSELFDRHLEARASAALPKTQVVAAKVPLTLVEENLECHLEVGIDAQSLREAGSILLGPDASAEDLADMVREIANVAGGALVTAADAEGVALSIGLPAPGDASWSHRAGTVQEFVLGVPGSSFEIAIRIMMESRELQYVVPKLLRPGMVIARHIVADEGCVLLAAGTRLTESSVARLSHILRPSASVAILQP